MPEGDTVWLTARVLDAALAGNILAHSDFRVPSLATVDLSGRRVLGVRPRGKHLLIRLGGAPGPAEPASEDPAGNDPGTGHPTTNHHPTGGGLTVHAHLRMTGSWRVLDAPVPAAALSSHEIRIVLTTERRVAVGYRIPVLELLPTSREDSVVGHLGPDLLGPDWDPERATNLLLNEPAREIGEALLDQRCLAGIGNLYKSETLFLRGINPWTRVTDVTGLAAVVELARRLLDANKERWEQVTTGVNRPGRRTYVFERAGKPCLRCSTLIGVARQGEPAMARLTYWCPSCQPHRPP